VPRGFSIYEILVFFLGVNFVALSFLKSRLKGKQQREAGKEEEEEQDENCRSVEEGN
jgi:hypothetical protein